MSERMNPFEGTVRKAMEQKYPMPQWADEIKALYLSDAAAQFVVHGNVNDSVVVMKDGNKMYVGNLYDFVFEAAVLKHFNVIITFDLGKGIKCERGEQFATWLAMQKTEDGKPPRNPRLAMEMIGNYLRFEATRSRTEQDKMPHIGVVIKAAHLVAPAVNGGINYDLSALASVIRDWTTDTALRNQPICTLLVTENLNQLHPLLVENARAPKVEIGLPTKDRIEHFLNVVKDKYRHALKNYVHFQQNETGGVEYTSFDRLAASLVGVSLAQLETMLKRREYDRLDISQKDLVALKKQMIEKDADGLIEFIESETTLADWSVHPAIKEWLEKDIKHWQDGDDKSMPMGYLWAAPIGCGKNYGVMCFAGSSGVPCVVVKSVRNMYQGVAEANQHKVIRLLKALGRVNVFVDEADQAMGKRNVEGDGGVSGRLYATWANEMSNPKNRGKIVWHLATSRCDLIEVDIKRPGRIDTVIPILPSATQDEAFVLMMALCKKYEVPVTEEDRSKLVGKLPQMLTAGAAESLAVKARRYLKEYPSGVDAVLAALDGYRPQIEQEVMDFQIKLAVKSATDTDFIPPFFLEYVKGK